MKGHQQMRSMALGLAGGACLVAAAMAVTAHADGPPTTSPLFYAGTIEDNGVLVDGDVPIGLALFDDEDTGAPETRLCDVPSANRPVTRGRFRIDASACLGAVTANGDVFVEVTVRGTPLPRQKLGAVPYAIEAEQAQSATIAEAVAAGSVDAAALANGAVTTTKVAPDAIDSSKLGDGAVTTAKLAADAVNGGKIADRSIQGSDILQESLGGDLLQSGTIERRHLNTELFEVSLFKKGGNNGTQTCDAFCPRTDFGGPGLCVGGGIIEGGARDGERLPCSANAGEALVIPSGLTCFCISGR